MIKLGIDARLYFQTGVGVYTKNLLHYLLASPREGYTFYLYFLKIDLPRIYFKQDNLIIRGVDSHWHSLSEQTSFLSTLYKDKLDLMHFTYFSYPVLYKRKFISTIHDLTPLLFKTGKSSTKNPLIFAMKYAVFKHVLYSQVKNSVAIITPTNTIKEQLKKIYSEKYSDKIYPIYEGVNYEFIENAKKNADERPLYDFEYLLYVGNFYPHKNVARLIEAYSKLQTNINLILAGPDDFFSKNIKDKVNKLNKNSSIIFHHNSTEKDLINLYKNSIALVHPAISEGFGLPLIEAAYFNIPIIASNIEVYKELWKDKYVAFDPYNVDDITNKINEFIKDKKKFDYTEEIEKYSFNNMAEKTFQIYEKYK